MLWWAGASKLKKLEYFRMGGSEMGGGAGPAQLVRLTIISLVPRFVFRKKRTSNVRADNPGHVGKSSLRTRGSNSTAHAVP